MTNTHGLKILGLKKVSGSTFNWKQGTGHSQINYNTETGELLFINHFGNTWTCYHDSNIILVCNTSRKMTMQEIADRTKESYDEHIYQSQFVK